MTLPLLILVAAAALAAGCGGEITTTVTEQTPPGAAAPPAAVEDEESSGAIGTTQAVTDADREFDLTLDSAEGDPLEVRLTMESTGGDPSTTNDLQFQSYVIGSDDQAYEPDPFKARSDCEASSADVPIGSSLKTCLTFPLPNGVEPVRYQFEPFIDGEIVTWDLR